jgi:hypothetical protein
MTLNVEVALMIHHQISLIQMLCIVEDKVVQFKSGISCVEFNAPKNPLSLD